MPARMANGFSREVTDFDRQMGCMAGMFQIFDRRRLLTGRRRGGSPGTGNEPPPGHDIPSSSKYALVHNSANSNTTPESSFSKNTAENSILSMESSRVSSSSSSCSSLSSLDGSKPVQQELPYINKDPDVGRTVRRSRSLNSCNKEIKSKQRNTDFRDVVKDSINREPGALAIKTTTAVQRNGLHKDSPRPLLISKSTDGTYVIAIDKSSVLPAYIDESRRQPRFSYDDRQLLQLAEAQDSQMPSSNLRELPRLSLDSRKESVKASSHLKNFGCAKTDDNLYDNTKSQESPSYRRASSVVAKLMGLEETIDISGPVRSHRQAPDIPNGNLSDIPRSFHPDPGVSQLMAQPRILKTKPSKRIVPEAAPWKQQERGITRYYDEAKPIYVSTYNDIERRFKHLALSECNKDLRALRTLGNLHAKHIPCQIDYSARLLPIQKATAEGNTTGKDPRSPVVINKTARRIMRPNDSVAPLATPKVHRKLQHEERPFTRKSDCSGRKTIHSHNKRDHSRAEEAVGSIISPLPTRSLSPRLVQKSHCSRIPLSVPQMSPAMKLNEVVSPRGRLRSKASQANSTCRDDKMSIIPESRICLSKQVDMGIIDYPNPVNVNTACSQSNTTSTWNHEETPPILSSDKKNIHMLENIPSPISVIDATFCQDGLSPSLRSMSMSNSFQDDATHTLDECWNPVSLSDTPTLKKNSEANHIIPEKMKALIQKLKLLQLLSDEAPSTNDNLLTVTANKDRHYIYEILLASGLLHSELSSKMIPCRFQLASYAINPEVFFILEQAKPAAGKLHRKLIFDLANELIAQKIHGGGSVRQQVQMIICNKSSRWHLFKELCSEIEMLQHEASIIRFFEEEEEERKLAKNAAREIGKWKSFESELQGVVLDIERHIFKNLIDEVLSSEATRKV